jgi:hypothetical protein
MEKNGFPIREESMPNEDNKCFFCGNENPIVKRIELYSAIYTEKYNFNTIEQSWNDFQHHEIQICRDCKRKSWLSTFIILSVISLTVLVFLMSVGLSLGDTLVFAIILLVMFTITSVLVSESGLRNKAEKDIKQLRKEEFINLPKSERPTVRFLSPIGYALLMKSRT